MVAQPHRLLTAEEFAALPNDGLRLELIRGELFAMPPAFMDHGGLAGTLHSLLGYYVHTHHLGQVFAAETGFLLARDPDTVLAPDFAFIQTARLSAATASANWGPVVPDLVVEVLSSGDRPRAVAGKVRLWLDAGARLVWVVSPAARTVTAHRPGQPPRTLSASDTLDGEEIIPGFTVSVSQIFS